jgi:hypothetical protein
MITTALYDQMTGDRYELTGPGTSWWEAGYVPGYRVCMSVVPNRGDPPAYDVGSLRHRFGIYPPPTG